MVRLSDLYKLSYLKHNLTVSSTVLHLTGQEKKSMGLICSPDTRWPPLDVGCTQRWRGRGWVDRSHRLSQACSHVADLQRSPAYRGRTWMSPDDTQRYDTHASHLHIPVLWQSSLVTEPTLAKHQVVKTWPKCLQLFFYKRPYNSVLPAGFLQAWQVSRVYTHRCVHTDWVLHTASVVGALTLIDVLAHLDGTNRQKEMSSDFNVPLRQGKQKTKRKMKCRESEGSLLCQDEVVLKQSSTLCLTCCMRERRGCWWMKTGAGERDKTNM